MKIFFFSFYIFISFLFLSCEDSTYESSIEGFSKLESDLLIKFGKDSYFTDFIIKIDENEKLEVNLLVTDNPYSYKMSGWNYKNGVWNKITEVVLELRRGNIKNYLYSLQNEVNILKMGFLVEESLNYAFENNNKNIELNSIEILSPNKGGVSKRGYVVLLSSKSTKIKYHYNLEGYLIKEEVL